MTLAFILTLSFSACAKVDRQIAEVSLRITEPQEGSAVERRVTVRGEGLNAHEAIWVVVHPTETFGYWVQPKPTIHDSGSWKVKIYIGRQGTIDVGKEFEIMAFSNPSDPLREGLQLPYWPEAGAQSQVIEVIRK